VTDTDDRKFPAALVAALSVELDWDDGNGIDFEGFSDFLSAEDTTDWFQAWTGNAEVTGDQFRVFGKDGTGGYAAFWLIRPGSALADQPVVFLGSEGETGVVAQDLSDFLWLLAGGVGPQEAITPYGSDRTAPFNQELVDIAERFAPGRREPHVIVKRAAARLPDLDEVVMGLCR
jgi:hypothetical protein